jgi:hypothetical protein
MRAVAMQIDQVNQDTAEDSLAKTLSVSVSDPHVVLPGTKAETGTPPESSGHA